MNIEFTCVNCGANLKVLKTFSGKSIQCPKCTKKTAVPAADGQPVVPPAPAAPKVAPAAGPASVDGIYIAFACGNCAAPLKVVKSFAGKTIQCPKCAKKTMVPGLEAKEAPVSPEAPIPAPEAKVEPAPAPAAAPAPKAEPVFVPKKETFSAPAPVGQSASPPAAEKPADPVPAAPAPAPDEARLREQEQKLDALMRQMRDLELRLDIERLKAEKAEKEKDALAVRKIEDKRRLEDELSVHFKVEMEAAKQTISRLEDRIRQATEKNLATPQAGVRSAAQIEKDFLENPDEAMTEAETALPDAVMAQIRDSRFGRYMRTSILLHLLVLILTSLGLIKSYFVKPPPVEGEGAAGTNAVATATAPAADAAPAAAAEKPAAGAEVPAEAAAAKPVVPAAAQPGAPVPATEALPAPGEKPPAETAVELGL